jgi:hypothetical protein
MKYKYKDGEFFQSVTRTDLERSLLRKYRALEAFPAEVAEVSRKAQKEQISVFCGCLFFCGVCGKIYPYRLIISLSFTACLREISTSLPSFIFTFSPPLNQGSTEAM